jgi:hypothetical protein
MTQVRVSRHAFASTLRFHAHAIAVARDKQARAVSERNGCWL